MKPRAGGGVVVRRAILAYTPVPQAAGQNLWARGGSGDQPPADATQVDAAWTLGHPTGSLTPPTAGAQELVTQPPAFNKVPLLRLIGQATGHAAQGNAAARDFSVIASATVIKASVHRPADFSTAI